MCKQFSSMLCAVFTCPSFSGCVCVEEEGGIFVKSFYKCSILGEADFLMEALIAWSFKRKYLLQELLVIVYTKQYFSKQLHRTQGFFSIFLLLHVRRITSFS